MKLTNGDLSIDLFKDEIKNEIEEYKLLLSKKGASIPINIISDTEFEFGSMDLRKLCSYYFEGTLSRDELAYIADAIELSSNIYVPDDRIKDIVFEMTDSEINGIFSKERANEILLDTAL